MGTYYGSTAASSVMNPPVPLFGPLSRAAGSSVGFGPNGGSALWLYSSTNTSTETPVANFISDAWYLGMRPGDIVDCSYQSSQGSTSGYAYRMWVASVSTSGAVFSTGQLSTS